MLIVLADGDIKPDSKLFTQVIPSLNVINYCFIKIVIVIIVIFNFNARSLLKGTFLVSALNIIAL